MLTTSSCMGIIKWLLLTPLTLKIRQYFYGHYTWSRFHKSLRMQLDKLLSVLQPSVSRTAIELVHYHHNLPVGKNRLLTILVYIYSSYQNHFGFLKPQGPVVRKLISTNLRLNYFTVICGFLFLLLKSVFSGNFLHTSKIIQSSYCRHKE